MAEGYTPEEDFTQDGYEGNEAEKIEMENRDSWEQTQDEFAESPEQETSFVDLPNAPGTPVSLAVNDKFKDFFKYMQASGHTFDRDTPLANNAFPIMDAKKALFITYLGKNFRLTHTKITRIIFTQLTH